VKFPDGESKPAFFTGVPFYYWDILIRASMCLSAPIIIDYINSRIKTHRQEIIEEFLNSNHPIPKDIANLIAEFTEDTALLDF